MIFILGSKTLQHDVSLTNEGSIIDILRFNSVGKAFGFLNLVHSIFLGKS
jgi:hypothetical protein